MPLPFSRRLVFCLLISALGRPVAAETVTPPLALTDVAAPWTLPPTDREGVMRRELSDPGLLAGTCHCRSDG